MSNLALSTNHDEPLDILRLPCDARRMAQLVSDPPARTAQDRIAGVIRALMAAHGEDQDDLGAVIHLGQSGVSRLLRGERRMTVDELDLLAQHYHVEPNVFFAGPEAAFRPGPPDGGGGNTRYRRPRLAVVGGRGRVESEWPELLDVAVPAAA